MKRIINALAIALLMSVVAYAQEYKSDKAKLYAGFVNISDVGPDDIQGVNGQAQIKLVRIGPVQFDAVGDYAGYFPGYDSFHTFQAGPRVGAILAKGKVVPYGGIQFGALTDFDGYSPYAYMINGGVDLNVNKYAFVRGEYGRQVIPDFAPLETQFNRVSIGVGLRIR